MSKILYAFLIALVPTMLRPSVAAASEKKVYVLDLYDAVKEESHIFYVGTACADDPSCLERVKIFLRTLIQNDAIIYRWWVSDALREQENDAWDEDRSKAMAYTRQGITQGIDDTTLCCDTVEEFLAMGDAWAENRVYDVDARTANVISQTHDAYFGTPPLPYKIGESTAVASGVGVLMITCAGVCRQRQVTSKVPLKPSKRYIGLRKRSSR